MKNNDDRKMFQEVYEFATENVAGYLKGLDLCNKSVLTVGSSLDQAFNALVLGAKNVVVYDINVNTEKFYKIKKELVLAHTRKSFVKSVKNVDGIIFSSDKYSERSIIKMNNYLQSDSNYNLLRERLSENVIEVVSGNIFNMNQSLEKRQFDRIIFSNVLQYIDEYTSGDDIYKFLADNFLIWKDYLSDEGIMQLLYLYSFSKDDLKKNNHSIISRNLQSIISALDTNYLCIEWIDNILNNIDDAVVTYTKKR